MILKHLNLTVNDVDASRKILEIYFSMTCVGSRGKGSAAMFDENQIVLTLMKGKDVQYPKTFHLTEWLNMKIISAIFNYMVNNNDKLDKIFHALADSTRREIVHMMAQKEWTVSELAEPFDMSLAGVSKHIKVLEGANLLERSVNGRTHICRLNAESLSQATKWLNIYENFWNNSFDLLESELLKAKKKEH